MTPDEMLKKYDELRTTHNLAESLPLFAQWIIDNHDEPEKPVNTNLFSEEYKKWVVQAKLEPLTNIQHEFAEFLLLPENQIRLAQIGDLNTIYASVRKYIKSNLIHSQTKNK